MTTVLPSTTDDCIRLCEITQEPLDLVQIHSCVADTRAGAAVLFVGSVREFTEVDGECLTTTRLRYDAYEAMAERTMWEIGSAAAQRWSLTAIAAAHRIGNLQLGDLAVVVAVSSPHRNASFEAGQWILEEIKTRVPIWKREHWSDGREAWQHPAGGTP